MEDYKHLDRKLGGELTHLTRKMTLVEGGSGIGVSWGGWFIDVIRYSTVQIQGF